MFISLEVALRRCSVSVLKSLAKITVKPLCWNPGLNKVAGWKSYQNLEEETCIRVACAKYIGNLLNFTENLIWSKSLT